MIELRVRAGEKKQQAQALRQKALEPQIRRCYLIHKDVHVLVEYPDYRGPRQKGPEGELYCENIVACYQADRKCRYSGISPLYPDPFLPREVPPEPEEGPEPPAAEAGPEPPAAVAGPEQQPAEPSGEPFSTCLAVPEPAASGG